MPIQPEPDSALLIVDVQNDFCPGGSLAVDGGDEVIPILNEVARSFAEAGRPVIATRDWHPARTTHFKEFGGVWPVHCVMGTKGGEFHPALELPPEAVVVSKGMGEHEDSYSGFDAVHRDGRSLAQVLFETGSRRVYVGGLATDYCVKHSVLDGRKHGLEMIVLRDAVRGVDLQPGDSDRALAEMQVAGATVR
ncbi:MAG: nicotinamidase [Chloroflexota bacterium]|nr:nicotinamidase [Chloroflexota bacterium]